MASDDSHSSYIQNEHIGSGNTQLTFGTSAGNVLPIQRMLIDSFGNVTITNNITANSITSSSTIQY